MIRLGHRAAVNRFPRQINRKCAAQDSAPRPGKNGKSPIKLRLPGAAVKPYCRPAQPIRWRLGGSMTIGPSVPPGHAPKGPASQPCCASAGRLLAVSGRQAGCGSGGGRTDEIPSCRIRLTARIGIGIRHDPVGGRSSVGRAPGCGPGRRGFESRRSPFNSYRPRIRWHRTSSCRPRRTKAPVASERLATGGGGNHSLTLSPPGSIRLGAMFGN